MEFMMPRTISQQLEHDLSCAIETGNFEEANAAMLHAEDAFEDGRITGDELGTLAFDFTVFQDSLC